MIIEPPETSMKQEHYASVIEKTYILAGRWFQTQVCQNIDYKADTLSAMPWLIVIEKSGCLVVDSCGVGALGIMSQQ